MIIILNPVAGARRRDVLWQVLGMLAATSTPAKLVETTHRGHAERLAREAVSSGFSTIVAAGGDGTIAEVVNGMIGSPARLGVIPLGTANVVAREFALPCEPTVIARTLIQGCTKPLWPGMAHGLPGSRLFVQMLSVGFDAQVVHHLPSDLKRHYGRGAYVWQTIRELARYRFGPIRLSLDGETTETSTVVISKGRLYGGRYILAPAASASEAGFSVVLLDRPGIVATLRYGTSLALGRLPRITGVRYVRAQRIDFHNDEPLTQTDGDATWTPQSVTDAPTAVPLICGKA